MLILIVPWFFKICWLNPTDIMPIGFALKYPSTTALLQKPLISALAVLLNLNCWEPFTDTEVAETVTKLLFTIPSNLLLKAFTNTLLVHHFVKGTLRFTDAPYC